MAGVAAAGLAALLATSRRTRVASATHPDPRAGITAERVLPASMVMNGPHAVEAYAAARSVPQVLDGLFCYCHCAANFGHRSLLTCFESDHGSQCDICTGEAILAARLAAQGHSSLDQIRQAIDQQFGS